jgi:hypothetical protein
MKLSQILEYGADNRPTQISFAQFDNYSDEQFDNASKKFELNFINAVMGDMADKEYSYAERNRIRNLIQAGLVVKDEEGNYSVTQKGKTWAKGFSKSENIPNFMDL